MTDPAAARREAEEARKKVERWLGRINVSTTANSRGFTWRPTPESITALDAYGAAREALGRAEERTQGEGVTMPLAVAERLYQAIIALPANLTPELCEAVENFYRHVRTAPARQRGGAPPEPIDKQDFREFQAGGLDTIREGIERRGKRAAPPEGA